MTYAEQVTDVLAIILSLGVFPIRLEDEELFYVRSTGDGSRGSLVFVHGAGGDGNIWQDLSALIPSEYTVIAMDLPGHNHSPGPAYSTVAEYAARVADFLLQLELPRPITLVGHSMGGAIVLTVALQNRELIDGLIMIGSGARLQVLPQFLEQLEQGILDGGFLGVGFSPSTPLVVKQQFLTEAAKVPVTTFFKDFTACSRFDVREQVSQLSIPLLLLVGEDDKLTPPKMSYWVAEKIPDAKVVVIPGAGHFAMLEQSQLLSQEIINFITTFSQK